MVEYMAFERRQIADIVGVSYALVKNWTNGKTFEIMPLVSAPSQRGASKLYSLPQLYLMAITATLKQHGVHPDFVRQLLPLLKPAWFRREKRGVVIYGRSSRGKIKVVHVMIGLRGDPFATALIQFKIELSGCLNLRQTLDNVDRRVAKGAGKFVKFHRS